MADNFWTTQRTSYGVYCCFFVVLGAFIGHYFGDFITGALCGAVVSIFYGSYKLFMWIREHR